MKTSTILLVGVIVGCVVTVFSLQGVPFKLSAHPEMSYSDLAAIILSAVSVIVTVLGVGVAILAIWGYSQFKRIAQESASGHIATEIKNGELKSKIETLIATHVKTEIETNPKLKEIFIERVDEIILSDAENRAKREAAAVNEESEHGD